MVIRRVNSYDLIKGIGAGLCLLDKDFRILWVNKIQSNWFGAKEDICGRHCYKMFEHRNHICRGCPTLKVFKTGKTNTANRIGFTKEGKKRYYQLTVSPVKDNKNHVIYALELVQDVTDIIISQRQNAKIINKLKAMYHRLSLVNRRLNSNVERLKGIAQSLAKAKRSLNEQCRSKNSKLIALKEELQDIFKVNRTLSSNIDVEKISSLITRLTCELMHTDACVLRLLDEEKETLVVSSSYAISDRLIAHLPELKIGEGISGKVAQAKKPLAVNNLGKHPTSGCKKLLRIEGFTSVLSVPVVFQGKVLGVIGTYTKRPRKFSEDEIEVLSIFAGQVAIAIQESKHYEDIHRNYFNTIHALVLAVEARDPYTRGHTERVTKFALQIGRALELSVAQMQVLRYASEVHDIGKISVSDFILSKPGRLTPAERAEIELHPIKGVEVLEPLDFLRPTLPIVRHHHERFDGTGYPDGLEKENIPLLSRILACADSFDAMTSDRPYRQRKLNIEEALVEIKHNIGSQFDPRIAHLFIKIINRQST
jgi:PAS domain S-box-containing protein